MLARIRTGLPSEVVPGPAHVASASRCSRSAATLRSASPLSGSSSTTPVVPSTRTFVPAAMSSAPVVPTTQGMPSCRAMIAVWLVGPPRSVTSASTSRGSRPAVSAGARSAATSTHGWSGTGTPGSGSPTIRATIRRSMSRRSVTRSAIRPPMPVKTVTKESTAACTAASRWSPERSCFTTPDRSPLSRASPALAVSTSAAAPDACPAFAANPSATAAATSSYRARADSSSGTPTRRSASRASAETSVRAIRAGPWAIPGTTGVPVRVAMVTS